MRLSAEPDLALKQFTTGKFTITATFFLVQSRMVVSHVINRFMPKVFVIFLREYVSPFYPSWDGFGKAGITTLLLGPVNFYEK